MLGESKWLWRVARVYSMCWALESLQAGQGLAGCLEYTGLCRDYRALQFLHGCGEYAWL